MNLESDLSGPRSETGDEESDESEESSSSSEEEEGSEGNDSGVEGNAGIESEEVSESDTEGESEIANDLCTHQQMCPSVQDCTIYNLRLNEEKRRLKAKLKKLKWEQRAEMEKRRALSIIRQTINVESKIAKLEQVLDLLYEARERSLSSATAEDGKVQGEDQQSSAAARDLRSQGKNLDG